MKHTIIRDTREQEGWLFNASKHYTGTICASLKTGDYTLQGFEDIFTIERKGSVAELAKNITEQRFVNELERLQEMKYAFILLEFTLGDIISYPVGSKIPPSKWKKLKIRGHFVLKKFIEMQLDYPNIHFVLCGSNGKEIASSIFKRVLEREE